MTNEIMVKKTQGLLISMGFHLVESSDGKFEIRNQANNQIARGDLETVYWCAMYMVHDSKKNPGKYESMNEVAQTDKDMLIQAGRELARQIREGR